MGVGVGGGGAGVCRWGWVGGWVQWVVVVVCVWGVWDGDGGGVDRGRGQ